MNKNSKGLIFFITLCIISIVSMLLLSLMQQVLLYHQAFSRQEIIHQHFYQLEGVASELQRTLSLYTGNDCTKINSSSPNEVIKLLLNHKGCRFSYQDLEYRYYIEDLGIMPCLRVVKKTQNHASQHLRISVLLPEKYQGSSLLQIRVVKASLKGQCLAKPRLISSGITSWRYLTGVS